MELPSTEGTDVNVEGAYVINGDNAFDMGCEADLSSKQRDRGKLSSKSLNVTPCKTRTLYEGCVAAST